MDSNHKRPIAPYSLHDQAQSKRKSENFETEVGDRTIEGIKQSSSSNNFAFALAHLELAHFNEVNELKERIRKLKKEVEELQARNEKYECFLLIYF